MMAEPLRELLTPENGLIFRLTHIRNLPWILDNGLHCESSATLDPDFVAIGIPDLIQKRATRKVPTAPGGTLSDYVPFYFTPRSPMHYKIVTGHGVEQCSSEDLVFLVASAHRIIREGGTVLVVDRHAYVLNASFSSDLNTLANLDWPSLQASDFQRRPDDPAHMDRYQAEALVHRHLDVVLIDRIVCYGPEQRDELAAQLAQHQRDIPLSHQPDWYFR
jgi:hypothetical protein